MFQATDDRRQLKSTLLAGAAGIAAVATTSAAYADQSAPPADPQKWQVSVDAGGGVGSGFTAGKLDVLAPVWQDMDSLLFVRLGATASNKVNSSFNLGLGYRTLIDPEWILGLYAGWDGTTTDFNHHNFNQVALGAELMSTDWDFRINGYIADTAQKAISNKYALFIHDTRIAILQGQEVGYSGIDGEVGYRIFHTDDTDFRFYVGGFWFEHSQDSVHVSMGRTFDFSYHDLAGPKARAEVNVFDLDELGPQSRLSFEAEVAHDSQRKTTGFVGATVRIPLDVVSGAGAQALSDLDRRFVDPVRRNDNVLTQWEFNKPEPVIMYGPHMRSQPTNTLLYVDNTAGLGSYADPTTLHDATTRTTVGTEHYENSFIVITSQQGDILVNSFAKEGQMQSGQSLVGGGETFHVKGTVSGTVFTHDFAPGTHDPTIEVRYGYDGVQMHYTDHDTIYGFTIEGDFYDAIHGYGVDHVNISEMNIDGRYDGGVSVYGKYGIVLTRFESGNTNAYMFGDDVHNVYYDGVLIRTNVDDGGTTHENIDIRNLTVTDAGNDGVNIQTYAYDSTIYQTVNIRNSTVEFVGNNGLNDVIYAADDGFVEQYIGVHDSTFDYAANYGMYFYAISASGGVAVQDIVVDPTRANYNYYGIGIFAWARYGDTYQYATLSDVNASYNYDDNIRIGTYSKGGFVRQETRMYDVTAAYSKFGAGVNVYAKARVFGTIEQSVTAHGLYVNGNYEDNIDLSADAGSYSFVEQSTDLYRVLASDSDTGYGLGEFAIATGGGLVEQFAFVGDFSYFEANYLDNVHVHGYAKTYGEVEQGLELVDVNTSYSKNGNGVYVYGGARDTGTVIQNVDLFGVQSNFNYKNGLAVYGYAKAFSAPAVVAQYTFVEDSTLDDNHISGVYAVTYAKGNYAATLSDNTIAFSNMNFNGEDGGAFLAEASTYGSAQQNVRLYFDDFFDNAVDGAFIGAGSTKVGFAAQYVKVYESSFDDNGTDGLVLDVFAIDGGVSQQNAFMYFNSFSYNGSDGVRQYAAAKYFYVGSSSVYYSEATQNVIAAFFDANENGGSGWYIHDSAILGGNIHQFTYIYGAELNSNGEDGITAAETAFEFAQLYSELYVVNSELDGNGNDGIDMHTVAVGPTYLIDHTLVAGSDLEGNGNDGFYNQADAAGAYSLNLQYVTLVNSYFDGNGNDGARFIAFENYGPGSFGAAIQDVTIAYSDFSYNGNDGLSLYAKAINRQGRAEQHFNIFYSRFDGNGNDGIYIGANAHGGTYIAGYPCQYVQGLVGGCAFVRQTVNIFGSDISYNGDDGIRINQYVNNYGAIYNSSTRPFAPTLYLYNTRVDYNGDNGLEITNFVGNASYDYEYVVAVNSHFDHNANNGIYAYSHVDDGAPYLASQMIQLVTLVGSTVDYNDDGIRIDIQAYDSFAIPGLVASRVVLYNSDVSFNGGDGIYMKMNASGTYQAIQLLYSYYSRVSYNGGDGVDMRQLGSGDFEDAQVFKAVYSAFNGNGGNGVSQSQSTEDTFEAYQLFYSYRSSFSGNFFGGAYVKASSVGDKYALQTAVSYYSTFDDNFLYNGLLVYSVGLDDFVDSQFVFSYGNDFSGNGFSGLYAAMIDTGSVYSSQTVISQYDVAIDNGGTAGVGVYGKFTGVYVASQQVAVEHGFMAGNYDGVFVHGRFDDVRYGYSTQIIQDNLVKYSSKDGIHVDETAVSAFLYNFTDISNNSVKYSGGNGIFVGMHADGAILENNGYYGLVAVMIDHNYVSNSYNNGIEVNVTSDGGIVTGTAGSFNTTINANTVNYSGGDGILIAAGNFDGIMYLGNTIGVGAGNYVLNSGGYGIAIDTVNEFGILYSGSIIENNYVKDNFVGGIAVNNNEFYGFTNADTLIAGNYVTGSVVYAGINIVDSGYGGTLDSEAYILGNSVTYNHTGIGVYTFGDSGVNQYDLIALNVVAGNTYGIVGVDFGPSSFQTINVYFQNLLFFNGTDYYFHDFSGGNQFVF
jgi:hypothetical protein